jgi:hypothetical protein
MSAAPESAARVMTIDPAAPWVDGSSHDFVYQLFGTIMVDHQVRSIEVSPLAENSIFCNR